MPAIGGDIRDITFNHPTLGGGTLFPKSKEDSTLDPGGFRTNDDENQIDASGALIVQMNRSRWSFEGMVGWDSSQRKEDEVLAAMAGDALDAEWTFTMMNGVVKAGSGRPVGDIKPNGNTATLAIKIAGGGVLENLV